MSGLGHEQVFSIAVECPDLTQKAVGCSCATAGSTELLAGLVAFFVIARRRRRSLVSTGST